MADHISRLTFSEHEHQLPIIDTFPDESLFAVQTCPWYADIINYLVTGKVPEHWNRLEKSKFMREVKRFFFDDPYLFKFCFDQVMIRCVFEEEIPNIMKYCHSLACGGHFSANKTAAKILQCGFYWPSLFKDVHSHCKTCPPCQSLGRVTKRNMMPLHPIIVIEVFDCWGIDFMVPFS